MGERVGCKHCDFKGYTKCMMIGGSSDEEGGYSVAPCSRCKDMRGYYAYVRNKYGTPSNVVKLVEDEPSAEILDFNEFKQRRKKEDGE